MEQSVPVADMRPARLRFAIPALGLSVLATYGITFYALGTAAPQIAASFGVGTDWIFGIFSAALPDQRGHRPRPLDGWSFGSAAARALFLGSLGRAAAIVAMTLAPNYWSFAGALIVVMMFGQITEYDAAFAAMVQSRGVEARRAISQITLWGGFASTVFWPLTATMLEAMTWRQMYLIYAALMVLMALPIGWIFSGKRVTDTSVDSRTSSANMAEVASPNSSPMSDTDQRRVFWLLVAAFGFSAMAMAIPVLFLPVMEGLGFGATALIAGTVFGPSQTGARAIEFLASRRWDPMIVAVGCDGSVPAVVADPGIRRNVVCDRCDLCGPVRSGPRRQLRDPRYGGADPVRHGRLCNPGSASSRRPVLSSLR